MNIKGKKRLRTCLSMLLVVTCFLTSFLFVNINSHAQEFQDDSFYILDEEGNPVVIEAEPVSMFRRIRSRVSELFGVEAYDTEARSNVIGVVRFKNPGKGVTTPFTEVDTGRQGYFYWASAGDAAYIRTEADGSVICKLAGAVMKVPGNYIGSIDAFETGNVSYYLVTDTGQLRHYYSYYSGGSLNMASSMVGYKQGYLDYKVKYYSYDGHYFYKDFAQMISDYRNNTYSNAVNAATPYYNYYQYLSMHTTAPFSGEQYDSYIRSKRPDSVMTSSGNAFVATQNTYTVNALLMLGIAINETGWGTNTYSASPYNNLFSINAVDSNPDNAKVFPSQQECINQFAYQWVHKGYLNGTDSRYRGPHLGDKHSGMNVKYASDPYWGEKAAAQCYAFDSQKQDYGRYSVGIAKSGKVQFYKEADAGSKGIYTSEAGAGRGTEAYLYDFPVMILETVDGANGEKFYKVMSDMSLMDDRTKRNVEAVYNTARDYVYVKVSEIQMVYDGSGNMEIPGTGNPGGGIPEKTQTEVIASLQVANQSQYLTGFAIGNDVANVIAKVRALDGRIQIVVKNANGTQVTNGTLATGMTITITTGGSTVTYTVVIRGDINGDGKLTALDYVKLRNYLDGASSLSGAYQKSTDTTGDGNTSALDYVKLRNHLDNKSTIVQ